MKNHKQLIIIIVILVVVAIAAYVYFSRGKTETASPTNTLVSSNTGTNPAGLDTEADASAFAGSDIAVLLKNISSIKLDTAILANPSFVALTDTSVTLPPTTPSGRTNPFSRGGAASSETVTNP